MASTETSVKSSGTALSALKAMSKKEPIPDKSNFADTVNDVAINGAKREKTKVRLGMDPKFQETARRAAEEKAKLEEAETNFKEFQAEVRDYGFEKRKVWNRVYKTVDTTFEVPYEIEVEGETTIRYAQVICSNKYNVRAETIEQIRGNLGESFDRLFTENREQVLKKNCVDLFRNLLVEAGLKEDDVDGAMEQLFEEKVKIGAAAGYEQEVEKIDDAQLRAILDQAVTRSAPSLKFPRT